jgi:tRNA-specific 2-thiouridylase
LFSLRQEQLGHVLFPLGDMTKADSREVARESRLKTADKEESMEICFVPDRDYGEFLRKARLVQPHRGEIVTLGGEVLGHHDGIEFFTIGQRRGLGLSSGRPLYVVDLDAASNRVVVGEDTDLERETLAVERCNWIPFAEPPAEIEALVKIRYNHPGTRATIRPGPQGTARIDLHDAQRAITPGQACVFYQDDLVLGGGWIARPAISRPA